MLQKGNAIQVSWIPEKFAKKNKWLKLKGDNGWQVKAIWGRQGSKETHKRSQDHKKHGKGSQEDYSKHELPS